VNVYWYNGSEYDLLATIHDDGTVDGDSSLADHFRDIFSQVEAAGEDPADWIDAIQKIIRRRYNSGYYKTTE
jgi:hypothetical protein